MGPTLFPLDVVSDIPAQGKYFPALPVRFRVKAAPKSVALSALQ
jgi:hypothetical protein